MAPMEKNLLALDLGKGSLGMAISRSGLFVTPLPEVRFPGGHYEKAIEAVSSLLEKEKVERFVLGLPLFPSGDECEMTPIVHSFAKRLEAAFPAIPVSFQDERYTTVEASQAMRTNGKNSKKQKASIDSIAAAMILERYLNAVGQGDDI